MNRKPDPHENIDFYNAYAEAIEEENHRTTI